MILLDTHVLVWLAAEPGRLSRRAASAIRRARASDGTAIAGVTIWELAVLFSRGALRGHGTIAQSLEELLSITGVSVISITPVIAELAAQFPVDYPKDPIDRLIGGTARAQGIPLVTRDERIRHSPLLTTIW